MWSKIKAIFKLNKLVFVFFKEVMKMNFTPESQLVKSYVLLLTAGLMQFEDIPNLFNLREAVALAMTK